MISSIRRSSCSIRPLLFLRNVASRARRQQQFQPDENFGNLSDRGRRTLEIIGAQNRIPDDRDGYDKQEFDIKPRKNAYYYKWEISNYARRGGKDLKKALELFEEMKSEARLPPTFGNFSGLIYGCAKAGLTKRAFELYDEGRSKYFSKPSLSMITCLINACAECPFPEYGIKRLDWLRAHLKAQFSNIKMSDIHYRCMMKAYGKLGRIDLASNVFSEMINSGIQPNTDAFNMLLIGCASQKESGALLALRVYKRMRLYDIKPDFFTYSTLLRCIHYCGMGSPELLQQTLMELPAMTSFEQRIVYKAYKNRRPTKEASKEFEWLPSILDLSSSIKTATTTTASNQSGKELALIEGVKKQEKQLAYSYGNTSDETALMPSFMTETSLPNLLSDDHLTLVQRIQAIQFDKLNSGLLRFQLFGGPEGFLGIMKRDGCEPDIKLFVRLCALVRPDRTGLLPLFHLVKEYPITRNENLYNDLIKYACENHLNSKRMDLALCFLEEMHRDGLRPSVSTFECLAPACDTLSQALTLIDDIERCGFVVSDGLVGQLVKQASRRKDFGYLIGMIELCRDKFRSFLPTKELLENLEASMVICNRTLAQYEKGKISSPRPWLTETNIAKFDNCKQLLGYWLRSVEVYEEEHPWQQYDELKLESKRQGFVNYVREFQALEKLKKEALDKGQSFGNLYEKIKSVDGRAVAGGGGVGVNERQQHRQVSSNSRTCCLMMMDYEFNCS